MPVCELCGKQATLQAIVEGSQLAVCDACSKFGQVVKVPVITPPRQAAKHLPVQPAARKAIVGDAGKRVKAAREKLALTQEDFAKRVNEKVSVVRNLESGHLEISLALAEKLQALLHVKLIEEYVEEGAAITHAKAEQLTVGDVIKVKRRQ